MHDYIVYHSKKLYGLSHVSIVAFAIGIIMMIALSFASLYFAINSPTINVFKILN